YDEVLRVPLLIRYPRHIPAGKIVKGQVRLMDVPATLMELAGLRVPKPTCAASATSLAAELLSAGEGVVPPLPAFGDLNSTLASLRTDRQKLIWNLRTNERELYDLLRDPGEQHGVAAGADPLAARLARWRSSTEKSSTEKIELDEEEKSALQ